MIWHISSNRIITDLLCKWENLYSGIYLTPADSETLIKSSYKLYSNGKSKKKFFFLSYMLHTYFSMFHFFLLLTHKRIECKMSFFFCFAPSLMPSYYAEKWISYARLFKFVVCLTFLLLYFHFIFSSIYFINVSNE